MTMEESMIQQYGSLLTMTQLAAILDRTPEGLRITLQSAGEWVKKDQLNAFTGRAPCLLSYAEKSQLSWRRDNPERGIGPY